MSNVLVIADPRHGYMLGLAGLIESGAFADLEPGKAYRLEVLHDPDCPCLSGGLCRCEPDFRLKGLE